ncbi:MAG: hypothetical protein QOI05_2118 [Bradyrhizobium sp.]|jgi:hypothetical protein|nr:hypothetical protein [Bradyrhizobium sp.]
MKSRLIFALAIGALISTVLQVMESLTDYSIFWMGWEMPGISAAFLFWGVVGGSAFVGIAIAWVVNAIVYGAAAFGVLTVFKLLTPALPK